MVAAHRPLDACAGYIDRPSLLGTNPVVPAITPVLVKQFIADSFHGVFSTLPNIA